MIRRRGKLSTNDETEQPYFYHNISSDFNLKEQEIAAEKLLRQVIRKTDEILKSERKLDQETNRLPDHLEKFKRDFEELEKRKQTVKLPIISQISPRSKKKISLLPPPNENEKHRLDEIEKLAKYIKPKVIYNQLETKTLMASEQDDADVSNFYNSIDKLRSRPQLPKPGAVSVEKSSTRYYDRIASNIERKVFQTRKIEELLNEKKVDTARPSSSSVVLSSSSPPKIIPGITHSHSSNLIGKAEASQLKKPRDLFSQTIGVDLSLPIVKDKNILSPSMKYEVLTQQKLKLNELTDTTKIQEQEKEYLNQFSVKVYEEIGVDLNKEYNRIRRFKNCIKIIMVHYYKSRTSAAFAWWVNQTKRCNIALQHRAATKINQAMFSAMFRKNDAEKKKLRREQFEAEMERRRVRNALRSRMANKIKLCIWKYVYRKLKARKAAKNKVAILLQKRYRGWRARVYFNKTLSRYNLCNHSATVIQTAFRRSLAIRLVRLKRKIHFVEQMLNHLRQMREQNKILFLHNGAELYIAKAVRAFHMRKKLNKLIYWNRFVRAVTIQRMYRGYRARVRCTKLGKQKRKRAKLENESAVKVQAIVRSFIARCHFIRLLEKREERMQKLLDKKARYLMKKNGRNLLRKALNALRSLKPFKYVKLNKKATTIQRVWRGHHAYVRCFLLRVKRALDRDRDAYMKRFNAAVTIQRIVRGFLCRLHRKRALMNTVIVKIQCFVRVFLAKMRVRRRKFIRNCARTIARNLFRLSKRKLYYQRRKFALSVYKYVVVIQRLWRRVLGSRRFRNCKTKMRVQAEIAAFIRQRLLKLQSSVELRILVDTVNRGIGVKFSTISGQECLCLGPLQAIFVLAACSKPRTDVAGLIANKLDAVSLSKFAHRVQGMMLDGKAENSLFTDKSFSRGGSRGGARLRKNNQTAQPEIGQASLSRLPTPDDGNVNTARKPNATSSTNASNKNSKKKKIVSLNRGNMNVKLSKAAPLVEAPVFAILEEIKSGRLTIPANKNKITPTELDILFNKSKRDAGNTLAYMDFVQCLGHCARQLLGAEKEKSKAKPAPSLVVSQPVVVEPQPAGIEPQQVVDDPATVPQPVVAPTSTSTSISNTKKKSAAVGKSSRTKRVKFSRDRLTHPVTETLSEGLIIGRNGFGFTMNVPDYLLVLVVKIFISFLNEPFMEPIARWMETETRARIAYFVVKIQTQIRMRKARLITRVLAEKRAARNSLLKKAKYALKIQCCIRRFLARRRSATMAQKIILKYVPLAGDFYWHHRITKVNYNRKPKILREKESYSVSVPERGLENTAYCCYCSSPAEVNCLDCEESMCKLCFDSLHCKGQRRLHRKIKIPICCFCWYQVATKSCLTCVLRKPKPGSLQAVMDPGDRGTFCDSCFIHHHEEEEAKGGQGQLVLSKTIPTAPSSSSSAALTLVDRRKGMHALLVSSREAYLVHHHIHDKCTTKHNYDDLVQVCEECSWRSSSWRCLDCKQVYCNKCLVGLHSIGGPFSRHKAETLPYYTPEMHTSFSRDLNAIQTQQKLERIGRAMKIQRGELEYVSTIKLQSWWRMIMGKRRGKRYMKRRRMIIRSNYRFRKRETVRVRNSVMYVLRNAFGLAPALASDTVEEAVLRKVSVFRRQQARLCIWKNIDCMGFNQIDKTDQRKGHPRTGFDSAPIDELIEQAKRGGFRLPGFGLVTKGHTVVLTTCDLTEHLAAGDMLRIKKRIFKLVSVKRRSIELDRRWLEGDSLDAVEVVLYRLPAIGDGEIAKVSILLWNAVQHTLFDICWSNPLTQMTLAAMKSLTIRMIQRAKDSENEALALGEVNTADALADRIVYLTFIISFIIGRIHSPASYVNLNLTEDDVLRLVEGGDEHEEEKVRDDEGDEDDEEGEAAVLLKRVRETKKKTEQNRPENKRKVVPTVEQEDPQIAEIQASGEDDDDKEEKQQQDSKSNKVEAASSKSRNSLFSASNKKLSMSIMKKGTATNKDKAAPQKDEDDWDVVAKKKAISQKKKPQSSSKPAKDSSGAPALLDEEEDEEEEEEGDEEDGMSKAKLLQKKKKQQQQRPDSSENTVKIAKKLTAKEKRHLEITGGKIMTSPWYLSPDQVMKKKAIEDGMTREELAEEASDWKELMDPITEKMYFLNSITLEKVDGIPRAVAAKKELEFENSKNKSNFDNAQRRIAKLEMVTKNRLLITGGRKT